MAGIPLDDAEPPESYQPQFRTLLMDMLAGRLTPEAAFNRMMDLCTHCYYSLL
jgi:hypothetical protein